MSPYHRKAFDNFVQAQKAKHPDHPEAFEGRYLAVLEDEYMRGANGEGARIKAIEDLVRERHVTGNALHLVSLMQWDGKSTASDVMAALGPMWRHGEPDQETVAKAAEQVWDRVPAIRGEFPDKASYVALKRAESQGRVSVHTSAGLKRATARDFGKGNSDV